MSQDDLFSRIASLFEAACELPAEEWRAYLEQECGDDEALIKEVLELLEQDANSTGPILRGGDSTSSESMASSEFIEQLSRHRQKESRYKLEGEIARGGMGAILKVWDEDVGRPLAMKVILGQADREGDTPAVSAHALTRFLEEAQITGQLDHPGIVPVHELGIDDNGRVYFTMQLVKGRDFRQILELIESGAEDWSQTRGLGVLLKVCEAMSYAHAKGVIHRDLKPANIMVGRFGEVYVMDWGLGRVLGKEDSQDIRPTDEAGPETIGVQTIRADSKGGESPVFTRDGQALGTPAYMSPEQAAGNQSSVGACSDIYSIGAILYHLLTGKIPYAAQHEADKHRSMLGHVNAGPPTPVAELASAPPELVAICEVAMARRIEDRYSDVEALASDLRAWLEGRVVHAYRTGPIVEFRKWVSRNRAVARVSLALALLVVTAGILFAYQLRGARQLDRLRQEREAQSLLGEADELYPIHPEQAPRMQGWLDRARAVVQLLPKARSEFENESAAAERRGDATRSPGELHPLYPEMQRARELSASLRVGLEDLEEDYGDVPEAEREPIAREFLRLATQEEAYWRAEADRLEGRLEGDVLWEFGVARPDLGNDQLFVRTMGELAGPGGLIEQVQTRRELALGLEAASTKAYESAWTAATAAIRTSPLYGSLELRPQIGLVPLREDPDSHLWEFWHVLSGERPLEGPDGRWRITEDTGVVFVLIPGGTATYGRQREDPLLPRFYSSFSNYELPLNSVPLPAYFISKYEMTQWQWLRAAGNNPSGHWPGQAGRNRRHVVTRTNPVENVSFEDCERILARWNLVVPTDVQWEHAARGGVDAPSWNGTSDLGGGANHKDRSVTGDADDFDDGYYVHAPVDSFEPNPFGLYNVHGNVSEWCQDWFYERWPKLQFRESDGLSYRGEAAEPQNLDARIHRGGGHTNEWKRLRFDYRFQLDPTSKTKSLGVRPVRGVVQ